MVAGTVVLLPYPIEDPKFINLPARYEYCTVALPVPEYPYYTVYTVYLYILVY